MRVRTATLSYRGRDFVFGTKPALGGDRGAWVLEDVTGWFGGVDVRAEATDRLGHGQFTQRAFRGSRGLTLQATYIAREPDERLALERALSGMLYDGDYGTLTCETDLKLSCQVRLDGEVGIVENGIFGVELQVPLVATDPWLYGEPNSSFLVPQGTGVGLEYRLFSKGAGTGEPVETDGTVAKSLDASNLVDMVDGLPMGSGGKAVLSSSPDWSATPGGRSLRIGPGTIRASAAYVVGRGTTFGEFAGKRVTVTGTVHVEKARTDEDTSSSTAPPRGISIGMEHADGSDPEWGYATSESAPNEPGTYTVSVECIMPDRFDVWSGWFVRLFNGSTQVPVYWDDVSINAAPMNPVEPSRSLMLEISPKKVAQSFGIDQETGDYYVGQPQPGDVDSIVRRVDQYGVEQDNMILVEGGHMSHLAVESVDGDVWIWFWWPAHPDKAVRVKYRPGTVGVTDEDIVALPRYGNGMSYYGFHGDTVSVAYASRGARPDRFRLYDRDEFMAGDATPLQEVGPLNLVHAYQGHCHDDDYVYVNYGGSKSDGVALVRIPWNGGAWGMLSTSGVGQSGFSPRNEGEGAAWREATGDIVFAMGGGPGGARTYSVHDVSPARFDDPLPTWTITPEPVLTYGDYTASTDTVFNNGNADAYPTILFVGDFPGGVGLNDGSGAGTVEYPYQVTKRAPLRVEASGSAWVGATNVTSRLSKRDFAAFKIGPGQRKAPEFYALQGGTGVCEIQTRDTYI